MRKLTGYSSDKREGDVFGSYMEHLERRNVAPRTVETYMDCLKVFGRFLDERELGPPHAVRPQDLEDFRLWLTTEYERRVSACRQSTYVAVLRSLYRFMLAEQLVLTNPARELRYPSSSKRIRRDVLSAGEVVRLFSLPEADTPAGIRDSVMLRLFVFSGPRVRELAGVNVEDISLGERELVIRKGKGRRERIAFFDRDTQDVLGRYLARVRPRLVRGGEAALLVGKKGRRMPPYKLRRLVKTYGAKIGRSITPHSLRRTFCTLMLRVGVNLKAIAEMAGHERISTTARYTNVDVAELARVYGSTHPRAVNE